MIAKQHTDLGDAADFCRVEQRGQELQLLPLGQQTDAVKGARFNGSGVMRRQIEGIGLTAKIEADFSDAAHQHAGKAAEVIEVNRCCDGLDGRQREKSVAVVAARQAGKTEQPMAVGQIGHHLDQPLGGIAGADGRGVALIGDPGALGIDQQQFDIQGAAGERPREGFAQPPQKLGADGAAAVFAQQRGLDVGGGKTLVHKAASYGTRIAKAKLACVPRQGFAPYDPWRRSISPRIYAAWRPTARSMPRAQPWARCSRMFSPAIPR